MIQAQLYAQAGEAEAGLRAMDRAQAWMERTGVRVLEPEVHRMLGELLLLKGLRSDGAGDEAEAWFRRALELSRERQARWLELRAAVSLARLWQRQGRHNDARELLAGIYDWFTEGFDTLDLIEARVLLQELA